jgi:hypothetical protein
VPFFFEGAGGGLYQPHSAPSSAYIGDFVASEEGLRPPRRLCAYPQHSVVVSSIS